MISKKLLSEVLNEDIEHIYDKSDMGENYICYMPKLGCNVDINIYELAYKCKEWAFSLGCELSSFKANYSGAWFSTIKFVDVIARPISFNSNTEPEAIFKACQWILDNKES